MNARTIVQVAAAVAAIAAALVSYQLLQLHYGTEHTAAWFDAGCSGDQAAGGANCQEVVKSPYGVFPPIREGEPEGTYHTPTAYLGLAYYSVLAVWLIGVGAPSQGRWWLHLLPVALVTTGLVFSAWMITVMFTQTDSWCVWCLVTHALNLLIAVCLVLMWPRARAVPASDGRAPAGRVSTVAHPTGQVVLVTALAALLVTYGNAQLLRAENGRHAAETAAKNFGACMVAVQELRGSATVALGRWQQGEKHEIAIRPDDPVRVPNPGDKLLDFVVFSDFECPSCAAFETRLEKKIIPLFDGRIRINFKHYPINPDCNANVKNNLHPHACTALKMAEAARQIGGNEAFWKAHDYLFANRKRLKDLTAVEMASHLNMDPVRFAEAMDSEEAAKRVWEDVNLAAQLGVKSTPAVYVHGRYVDPLSARDLGFWDAMATLYWKSRGEPRPEHTKLVKTGAAPATATPAHEEPEEEATNGEATGQGMP